jgi:hypothetical protein
LRKPSDRWQFGQPALPDRKEGFVPVVNPGIEESVLCPARKSIEMMLAGRGHKAQAHEFAERLRADPLVASHQFVGSRCGL